MFSMLPWTLLHHIIIHHIMGYFEGGTFFMIILLFTMYNAWFCKGRNFFVFSFAHCAFRFPLWRMAFTVLTSVMMKFSWRCLTCVCSHTFVGSCNGEQFTSTANLFESDSTAFESDPPAYRIFTCIQKTTSEAFNVDTCADAVDNTEIAVVDTKQEAENIVTALLQPDPTNFILTEPVWVLNACLQVHPEL